MSEHAIAHLASGRKLFGLLFEQLLGFVDRDTFSVMMHWTA